MPGIKRRRNQTRNSKYTAQNTAPLHPPPPSLSVCLSVCPVCEQSDLNSVKQQMVKTGQMNSSPTTRLCCQEIWARILPATVRGWWGWGGVGVSDIQLLIKAKIKPLNISIYLDDSVTRYQSGWEIVVKLDRKAIHPN